MIELLKCFITGLGVVIIALVIVSWAMASATLVATYPCVGLLYIIFMILLIAVGMGWAIRNA